MSADVEEYKRLWERRIEESRKKNARIVELEHLLLDAPTEFIPPTYIEGNLFCRYCFSLDEAGCWEEWFDGHGHMNDCWFVRARKATDQHKGGS